MQSPELINQSTVCRKPQLPQRKVATIEDNRPVATEQAEMISAMQEYSANDVMRCNPLQLQKNSISTASSSNRVVQGYFTYKDRRISEEILDEIEALLGDDFIMQSSFQIDRNEKRKIDILKWFRGDESHIDQIISILDGTKATMIPGVVLVEESTSKLEGLSDDDSSRPDEPRDMEATQILLPGVSTLSDNPSVPMLDDLFHDARNYQTGGRASNKQPKSSHIPPKIEGFTPFSFSPASKGTDMPANPVWEIGDAVLAPTPIIGKQPESIMPPQKGKASQISEKSDGPPEGHFFDIPEAIEDFVSTIPSPCAAEISASIQFTDFIPRRKLSGVPEYSTERLAIFLKENQIPISTNIAVIGNDGSETSALGPSLFAYAVRILPISMLEDFVVFMERIGMLGVVKFVIEKNKVIIPENRLSILNKEPLPGKTDDIKGVEIPDFYSYNKPEGDYNQKDNNNWVESLAQAQKIVYVSHINIIKILNKEAGQIITNPGEVVPVGITREIKRRRSDPSGTFSLGTYGEVSILLSRGYVWIPPLKALYPHDRIGEVPPEMVPAIMAPQEDAGPPQNRFGKKRGRGGRKRTFPF